MVQNKVKNVRTDKLEFAQRVREEGNSHFFPSLWHSSRYVISRPLKTRTSKLSENSEKRFSNFLLA